MKGIKIYMLLVVAMLIHASASGQSFLGIYGGYSFGTMKDTSASTSGFKFNMEYENLTFYQHWAFGFQVAYLQVKTDKNTAGRSVRFSGVPFAGFIKYYLGKDKLKGYGKGLLGFESSQYKFEGPLGNTQRWDVGFMFGAGAGLAYKMNQKLHLHLDYQYDWFDNSYYRAFSANSISAGVRIELD